MISRYTLFSQARDSHAFPFRVNRFEGILFRQFIYGLPKFTALALPRSSLVGSRPFVNNFAVSV